MASGQRAKRRQLLKREARARARARAYRLALRREPRPEVRAALQAQLEDARAEHLRLLRQLGEL